MTNGEYVKDITSKFGKLAKFKGQDFRRLQKKMHFLLTTLKVVYVLSTPSPVWSENETLETTRKRMKWENDDYICRGHILNGMPDSLFDIDQNAESSKALWESLESKYMAEDASATKFLYTQHNLMMDKAISVTVIIDKLPPSWKEFKPGLKHKKEELNLVQLGSHLRIEKGLRNQELDNNPKGKNQMGSSSVNMVDGDGSKNSNNNKNKRKFKSGNDKFANKKGTTTHWKCKKTGHMKKDCLSRKVNDGAGSNRMMKLLGGLSRVQQVIFARIFVGFKIFKEMVNSMLSYSGLSEGFWEPNDYVSVNSIIKSRDDIFDEERFTSIPRPRGMIHPSSSKIVEDEVEGTDDVPGPSVPRKSTRTRKAKSFGSDFQLYLVEGTRDKTLSQREYCFIIEEDPRTLSEAMTFRDVEAVQSEIDSIMHNDTWELTDLPPGCKALGCKWILKRKMKVNGSIDKYKARLVIQGFRQKEGIDFFDTYALVAWISTIKLLLALAAIHDLVIHQMDVKTAFLNGDLDEKIYMKQPEGFVMPGHESKTCITSSTMESEFVALAAAGNEAEWLRNLVYEIPLWPKPISTISIRCYSAATLSKAYSQVYNGKSRHLGVKHSMIRELIMNGVISVEFVRTQLNLADHLTKGLARDLVRKAAIGMGLKST
nr:zinc finger, CCHC-type [Tanacetum cinerariifolium]